jgi:hypothetical protein
MPVYLRPCRGCPLRHGCEQRDEFRKRVSGLGLRSATFDCKRLASAIEPGTRVVVSHPIKVETCGYSGESCYDIVRAEVPATIVGSGRDAFSCVIDRDALLAAIEAQEGDATNIDTFRFRKTMKASRIIRFLDEPRRALSACGRPKLPGGQCDLREAENCCNAQFPLSEPMELVNA